MTEGTEEWRVISWAPKYQVSNMGRVIGPRGWELKPIIRNKYHAVNIYPAKDRAVLTSIHTLVLEEFVGPRPEGYHGCHSDRDRSNNRLSNLRWDTPKGNIADQIKHGTFVYGIKNGRSKLTLEDIEVIRSTYKPRCGVNGATVFANR